MGPDLKRIGLGVAIAALAFGLPLAASALESETCRGCHDDSATVGTKLSTEMRSFGQTAHAELGCPSCHESVTAGHPDDGLQPSKAICKDCHQEIADEYDATDHAGNASCGDCHNPHAAFASRQVSGNDMNRPCAACHEVEEMAYAHGTWLPQADLHLEMLPCVSCHTASENYVITLYLSKPATGPGNGKKPAVFALASYGELKAMAEGQEIGALIDTDGDNFVTLAELRAFNRGPLSRSLRLQGMLTPEVVTHNLQILDNRWDCTFCHASGPGAMQTSFVALPLEDGTYDRLCVEKGAILDALNGTPDFYMMGATRNTTLNKLGILIFVGGLVMPVGHGALRFLTRKNRR